MFSEKKRFVKVGKADVAYYEEGNGEPLLLLHGCPFSSYIWRKVIPRLSSHYRCLAPDLLGLGDTETPEGADWSLRGCYEPAIRMPAACCRKRQANATKCNPATVSGCLS